MARVVISSQGIVEYESGTGVDISMPLALSQFPTLSTTAQTSAGTLTSPGVYTLSGSTALTWVMPLASAVPGGTFIFRTASAHAHVLSGSQETAGTRVFSGQAGATPDARGSKLTLPNVQGSSVVLVSDGLSFLLTAASGSCTIDGT